MENKTKKILGIVGTIAFGSLVLTNVVKNSNLISRNNVVYYSEEKNINQNNKELEMSAEEFLRIEKEYMHDKLAFCIQKSQIALDGSIKAPYFFGQLPEEMKALIVFIKDNNVNLLESYLDRDINKNIAKIENELKLNIRNAKMIENYYQR